MAEKVLNLIPTDVGRPIRQHQAQHRVPGPRRADHTRSSTRVAPVEREVRDHEGRWYSLRIRPYKSLENRIDGAVVALFDIDAAKRHEIELRQARAHAEAIVDAVRHPLAVLDGELRVRTANRAFEGRSASTTGEARGRLDPAARRRPVGRRRSCGRASSGCCRRTTGPRRSRRTSASTAPGGVVLRAAPRRPADGRRAAHPAGPGDGGPRRDAGTAGSGGRPVARRREAPGRRTEA